MKIRTLLSLIAVFLVSLIVAVSCTFPQAPTSTTSPSAVSTNQPIRLGFSNWPSFLYVQVAEDSEIFNQNNINVDLTFYDYAKSVQALKQGEVQANFQTLSDTIKMIDNNSKSDPVIVLTTDASNGGDAIIVNKEIKQVADLKNKKIATEKGEVDHFMLLLALKKAGLSQADIQLESLDPRAAVAAFVEGQVDAVVVYLPYTKEALKLAGSKVLLSSKDFPQTVPSHLVVDRKLIEERRSDVQALVNTWFATLNFVRQNPENSYKVMADYLGVSVNEFKTYESDIKFFTIEENLKAFNSGSDLTSLPYAAEEFSNFLLKADFIKKKPDLSQLFDSSFVEAYADSLNK
ncbi:aliphatic sulfonate ABC transporter substrate-binding protein [Microcoleus sp. FACHB-672]|uniref:aliphatic sulfonate ABC transporter substrate-binding protein n=1 Tax=Microcoleus sp. FACHB-672 TaxID=2692825 RepID=UPI001688D2CE|nr:aliphatic sulfonate ABC transporter substrate-binding protein [Microcoleus sp. FACHB-672]MBD2043707.1 aliphatic sulfonate ABC transporter substrate-binding protein [Microcoleus sp. FACHB-672]